jgi:polysaccharide export outer membrane protein
MALQEAVKISLALWEMAREKLMCVSTEALPEAEVKSLRSAMKRRLFLALSVCLLILPGAVQAQDQKPPRLTTVTEDRYRLQPGDVMEVQFRYTPEFNQTVTVQPDGYVSLEIAGDLKVAGLTVEETRRAILSQAAKRLQDPVAAIVLKEFQKPYFVVAGEVAQPGKIEMREKVTALQAIMLAGGMKESAKSSQVVVFRKINSDTAEVKVLNLKQIRQTSDLENDLTLQAGDMVYVPRDKLSKVERFMRLVSVAALITPKL